MTSSGKKGVLLFSKFDRKTPGSKSFCNNCKLWAFNFIKKRLRHQYFVVNFGKLLLWTPFWKHSSKRLLWMKLVSNAFLEHIEIKITQLKLKRGKIYIHENQIQLINYHEIHLSHFLKERLRASGTRMPTTTCSANDYLEWNYLRWSSWQRLLTDTNR